MSAINVNSITGRTGLHGPVLTGVSTAADGFQVLAGEFKVNGISTFVGMSTFNGGIDVKDGGFTATGVITASGLDISNGQLNFTKADGVGINFKESGWLNIDSDNNDTNRNLSIYDAYGTASQKTLMVVRDNGFVGINTNNPATQLHVTGSSVGSVLRLTGNSNTAYGEIEGDNVGNLIFNADPGNAGNSSTMRFRVDGTERVRITSAGRVGIGTDDPSGQLQIDTTSGARALTVNAPTLGTYLTFETDGTAFADIGSLSGLIGSGSDTDTLALNARGSRDLAFRTNSNVRLRITSDGFVSMGVATPAPGAQLTVAGKGIAITGQNTDHGANSMRLGEEGSGLAQIRCYGPDNSTNGSLTLRSCRGDGTNSLDVSLLSNGNLSISDGNLVVASGHGIDFSATGDGIGTASSELLDDYEEGTWTPVFNAVGATFTTQANVARYTKVGNLVTISGYCQIYCSAGAGNDVTITGLPYNTANETNFYQGGVAAKVNKLANNNGLGLDLFVYPDASTIRPRKRLNNSGTTEDTALNSTDITDVNFSFLWAMTYRAA